MSISPSHEDSVMKVSSAQDGEEEYEKDEGQNLQPEPDYRELEEGDNSNFHDCIKEENWKKLTKMIKRYKSHYYKKKRIQARNEDKERLRREEEEKAKEDDEEYEEPTKFQRFRQRLPFSKENKKKRGKIYNEKISVRCAKKVLPNAVTKRVFVAPADIISPLLMVDSDGRTPLHLACIYKAPESIILDLLEAEKKATTMKDHKRRLPLHYAVQTWQEHHVIERIVKINPNALKSKDSDGRSPVGLAVDLALKGREEDVEEDSEDPYLWISPTTQEEKKWQFEQEMRWSKVNCLLSELIDRRKLVIPSEHGLILEALENGANPNTIIRFISASDRYLMMDDELAGMAIGLCVERHYTFDVLEYLIENCREKTTVITDILQKAVNTHYSKGCYPLREGMMPFGKRVIDWAKKQQRKEEAQKKEESDSRMMSQKSVRFVDGTEGGEDDDEERRQWTGMKQTCKDWWEVLNHLIFYCAYGRDYKANVKPKSYHLLHAALSAPTTPPSLIHLLLIVYPEALNHKCPVYKVLPVHIACTRWRYDVINHGGDASSLDQVLHYLYESNPDQLYQRHNGSLPIHMALFGGQFWAFVKSLTSMENNVLGMRDLQSRLFSFQIAALPIRFRNVQLLMRCQFNPTTWREMSFSEKKIQYEKVANEQEARQLNTIYELLRRYPGAIENRVLTKDPLSASQNLKSLSEVSVHYLSWIYNQNSDGEFRVRYDNLTALRNSIVEAQVLPELEDWWNDLKQCIWNESHGDIPRTKDYLLHSALYNSETPPLVTELLIELFPASITKPIPGTSTYPLHIAAGTASYQRQEFEIPYGMNNLRLVLQANKEACRFKSNGRLPLHICLARGKGWKEVLPLIMVDPSSLKVKDEQTGLFPFELIASFKLSAKENSLWYSSFTEKQMKTFSFHELPTEEKARALARARKKKDLSQLNCIFEIIRQKPSILAMRYSGFVANNDDDSVTSLCSLVDDGFEFPIGSRRDLMSRMESNRKSLRSFFIEDAAPLISPNDAALSKSLGTYLLDKEGDSSPTKKKTRIAKKKKNSMTNSNRKFERRGTKMSLFDFNDLDLSRFDDDESNESGSDNNEGQQGKPRIPVELPNLDVSDEEK